MKHIAQKLEVEMAKAVSLIVAASHAAALEALNEAFGVGQLQGKRSTEPGQPRRTARTSAAPRRRSRAGRTPTPRRSSAEMRALEERLLQEVWATPGEGMGVLSPRVGASPTQLQVPVARMKAARKLKTVGERQFTRYFPTERPAGGEAEGTEPTG